MPRRREVARILAQKWLIGESVCEPVVFSLSLQHSARAGSEELRAATAVLLLKGRHGRTEPGVGMRIR